MSLWRLIAKSFQRGPRRPLAHRQPKLASKDVPRGMEATNMDAVDTANRRNQSLERSTSWKFGFGSYADQPIRAFDDDETYAKTYHHLYDDRK